MRYRLTLITLRNVALTSSDALRELEAELSNEIESLPVIVSGHFSYPDGWVVLNLGTNRLSFFFEVGWLRQIERTKDQSTISVYQPGDSPQGLGLGRWKEPGSQDVYQVKLRGYYYHGLNVIWAPVSSMESSLPLLVYGEDGQVYPIAVVVKPLLEDTSDLMLANVTIYRVKLLTDGTEIEVKTSKSDSQVTRAPYLDGVRHSLVYKGLTHYRTSYTLAGLRFDLTGWHLLSIEQLKANFESRLEAVDGLIELAQLQTETGFSVEPQLQQALNLAMEQQTEDLSWLED